ncbi:MAG TPA: hypothetical protein ENF51_01600 [Candidatus Aenigmarchaeota archaeon]|nr:hypothetical protein [Candidatus Aenigmarchaeota archaeon]
MLEKELIKYSGMKKEEIRKALEEKIPYLLKEGKVGLVVGLVKTFGAPGSDVLVGKTAEYMRKGLFQEARTLLEVVRLPKEVVHEVYRSQLEVIIATGYWDGIRKTYELTGIKPKKEDIAGTCWVCLERDRIETLERLVEFAREIGSKVKLPEKVVRKKQREYARKGEGEKVKRLWEVTGVKPKLSKEDVLQGVNACLEEGRKGFDEGRWFLNLCCLLEVKKVKLPREAYELLSEVLKSPKHD